MKKHPIQLEGVAQFFVHAPAQTDRHCIKSSKAVRIASGLESINKHKKSLKVLWQMNSKLLARIPKRAQRRTGTQRHESESGAAWVSAPGPPAAA